tara:strand:+ start:582 stop:851 length:270 start_codon:yes stop_codon:yes gene_type:complete
MLASPKSRKVLDTILSAALDDDHKHQAAAWKIVVDRILPVGMFEKDVMGTGGRPSVNITITGVGGMGVVQEEEEQAVDVESFEYSGVDE